METKETTHTIWGITEDGAILKPKNSNTQSYINNAILIEISEDTEDGTYPDVADYIKLCNDINDSGPASWINQLTNDNPLDINMGNYRIVRENKFDTDGKLIFKEPIEVLFGTIGERQIIEKVTEISGEFTYDFFWLKNGRQDQIANGFEILFNIESYLK